MSDKYSLWIVPKDEAGKNIQSTIDTLAASYDAPRFDPHLTLVANILIENDEQYQELDTRITQLAQSIGHFSITLATYGYTDEEFRCLFLKAQDNPAIDEAYKTATQFFPQVQQEHFRALPHLSILYGHYTAAQKEIAIRTLPSEPTTFEVTSIDLYKTNSPISSWQLQKTYPFDS